MPTRPAGPTCSGPPSGWPISSAAWGWPTEIIPTAGHPLVYAESPPVPGAPTVLVYGHYDVQPPDPLDLWISPPFEPTRREGNLYARGATDDKGQMLTHVKSAEAWIRTEGRLPVHLKFIIEGEEEVGSQALEQFIAEHAERLACDCVVISDGGKFSRDIPAITYGLRGIAYYELRVTGPEPRPALGHLRRLGHQSGQRPGPDPGRRWSTTAARCRFPASTTTWCRFPTASGGSSPRCPSTRRSTSREIGVSGAIGEEGYTALERRWARPTCDICGLCERLPGRRGQDRPAGQGRAKISFRLVPNQDPHKITAALRAMAADGRPRRACASN